MRINDIEAFLAVNKNKSITLAAQELYVTQPTLSAQIKALEEEFGVQLIERKKGVRKTALTDAGKILVPYAEQIRSLYVKAKSEVPSIIRNAYMFACNQSMLPLLSAEINQALRELDSSLYLQIRGAESIRSYDMVASGEADIALCSTYLTEQYRNLCSPMLLYEKMVFVCRKDSQYEDFVRVNALNVEKELYALWNLEYEEWHNYWFGKHGKPSLQIRNTIYKPEYFYTPEIWSVMPVSIAYSLGENFRICVLDHEPPARNFYLVSTYPPKEPYYSTIKNTIEEKLSPIEGICFI